MMTYDELLSAISAVVEEYGVNYPYLEEAIAQAIYDMQGKDDNRTVQ